MASWTRSSPVGSVSKAVFKFVFVLGAILLAVAGIFRLFFVDMIVVGHNGMAPTILYGEEVLMWRGADNLELGDIVVCQHPADNRIVMGRLVGRNGVHISTERNGLHIGGQRPDLDIQEPRRFFDIDVNREYEYQYGIESLGNTDHPYFLRERFNFRIRPTTVSAGKIYLLSDNRSSVQHDSRSFGELDPASCLGTIFMRWKPVDDGGANLGHSWLQILE